MKLLYVVNQAETFFTHRLPWARAARDAGWNVHVAGPIADAEARLRAEGFIPHRVPFVRGLGGIGKQAQAVRSAYATFREVDPEVAHLVGTQVVATLGPVARAARVRHIVASITGLGHAFLTDGPKGAVLRSITVLGYAMTATAAPHVGFVFQNRDDLDHVRGFAPTSRLRAELIPGSGVDTTTFLPAPEPGGPTTFLLAARLLREKGVLDFVAAARQLRGRSDLRLVLVGDVDRGNPSSFDEREVWSWVNEGLIEWWGHSTDMVATLARAHVVVLPSFREGLPKVLLEGAAMARPLVATDVPGCREVVRHGSNGFLVPLGDAASLADAIAQLADSKTLRTTMGRASRELVESELSAAIISERYLAMYQALREGTWSAGSH
jgi:glycosyltransferase involved in cell wall biosynthesis